MTADGEQLKVGIVGGGIVGAYTALALSHLPNVSITAYEKSPHPSELGAWIALPNQSIDMLSKFIPIEKINSIAYKGTSDKEYVSRHWKTGEILYTQPTYNRSKPFVEARTHRVALLNLLLEYVPPGIIQYDHKVSEVEFVKNDSKIIIHFENQPSSSEFDLVVAADGIYSKIRHQFNPNTLKYRGSVAYRSVFDESYISHIEGISDDTSNWVSPGGKWVFLSLVGLGQYGIVASIAEPYETFKKLKWNKSIGDEGKKYLIEAFKDWDAVVPQVIEAVPDILAFPLESGNWLHNLVVKERLVFAGDAAHPTAGAYGSGAGFGFSDAWALYRSLQETSSNYWYESTPQASKYNLKLTTFLFNETRRHFLKRVEQQLTIDGLQSKERIQPPTDTDDSEWRSRYLIKRHGGEWIRSHNAEFEFQKIRDQYLVYLQKNLSSFIEAGHGYEQLDELKSAENI
ncbi:salicylate hydroxylase [Scheffersomyces amazonensis]|uniref:salicylate hydroxylase n=1 Tax=Scheffersomyces amazonensis TaxID=1078765 RepID=UPI00315D877E